MKSLSEDALQLAYIHSEHNKEFEIREMICLYNGIAIIIWHITELKKREGWIS